MMKVYIKNKTISWGGDSVVLDENKQTLFKVKGKAFSFTHKKRIKDASGKTIYTIRNKFWKLTRRTAFVYDENKVKIAKVIFKMLSAKREYFVEGTNDEIKIIGQYFSPRCEIVKNGEVIGTITRDFKLFGDAFELDAEEANLPFLVALVIALDNIEDSKKK